MKLEKKILKRCRVLTDLDTDKSVRVGQRMILVWSYPTTPFELTVIQLKVAAFHTVMISATAYLNASTPISDHDVIGSRWNWERLDLEDTRLPPAALDLMHKLGVGV